MRMLSGCPKKRMRTQAWRRDAWASQHHLDEVRCYQRKHLWDTHCGSEDAEMLYVSNGTSSELVGREVTSELVNSEASSEPVSNETHSEPVGHEAISQLVSSDVSPEPVSTERSYDPVGQDASSEPVSSEGSSELVSDEASSEPVGHETGSEPVSSEGSSDSLKFYGLRAGEQRGEPVIDFLQLKGVWPWSRKHDIWKHEEARTAQAQQTPPGVTSDVLVGRPTQPGCYMRMPSGCPKSPMRTQMWRHDQWAEQHELDRAGCEARKGVWDKYCETDDATVAFIPKQ